MQAEKYSEQREKTGIIRAAVVQLNSRQDVFSNLEECERLVAMAVHEGARLCVLPENFALMGPESMKLGIAEVLDEKNPGPILGRMMELARQHRIYLICGGMPERTPNPSLCLNASFVLNPEGSIVALYRKMHIFDVALPGRAEYRESAVFAAGEEPVVARTEFGGIGLGICYDLRFPELFRAESARGASLLALTAAFTAATGRDHWHLLVRARAVENQCFVLAADQCGKHGARYETYGHSMIVDPWGTVLADAGESPGIAIADLDLAFQERLRKEMPCLTHRRITYIGP